MNLLALEQLDIQPGDCVLEVGFGGGDLLGHILAATSGEIIGADISEAMLRRARRRFSNRRDRLRLLHASAEALPLPDASVDKAVSVNSLYFWPDPAAAMAELARIARPGGTLVLCFETAESLREWPGHIFGFRLFEAAEVEALMTGAGFGGLRSVFGAGGKPDLFCCLSGERLGANGSNDGR